MDTTSFKDKVAVVTGGSGILCSEMAYIWQVLAVKLQL